MLAENSDTNAAPKRSVKDRTLLSLRLILSLGLSALGLWLVARDTSFAQIVETLLHANFAYVFAAVLVILVTTFVKTWRWRLLFHPAKDAPPFSALFWSLSLGQFVNTTVPFLRLGEIARAYDIGDRTQSSKSRALGTVVVEKTLDLIVIAGIIAVLLPSLVIPDFAAESGLFLGAVAIAAGASLYLVAYRPQIVRLPAAFAARWLPKSWSRRVMPIIEGGLGGLAALRSRKKLAGLLIVSAALGVLSIVTPFVLFGAVGITLGLAAAAAIHVVLTVGTMPPSTPAKVGVFEFLVAFMLRFFGVEDAAVILAYTILYHLVVVLPQIILGGIALARGGRRAPS